MKDAESMSRACPWLFPFIPDHLDTIPFHRKAEGIERLIAAQFPWHLAVHRVVKIGGGQPPYVEPHVHTAPELNLVMPSSPATGLTYEIQLGEKTFEVTGPQAVWIPGGLSHAANALRGEGWFVCLVLAEEYGAERG